MGNLWFFNDGAALLGPTSLGSAALRTRADIGVLRHKKSRTASELRSGTCFRSCKAGLIAGFTSFGVKR